MRPIIGQSALGPCESANPHLWDGLVVGFAPCISGAGRNVADLSPSRYGFILANSAAAFFVVQSPIGPACRFAGNAGMEQQDASWGLPCKMAAGATGKFTIQAVLRYNSSGTHNIFRSDNKDPARNYRGYQFLIDGSINKPRLIIWDDSSTGAGAAQAIPIRFEGTSSTTMTQGAWHHVIVTWNPDDVSDPDLTGIVTLFHQDGELFADSWDVSPPYITHNTEDHSRIGTSFGTTAPNVDVALVNVWNYRLPFRDMDALYADPLAMYRRRRRPSGAKSPATIVPWWNNQRRRVC